MIDFANDVCRALANGARDRDAAAYRTGDDVRSYGALWADAQRTAGLLRRQGTGPVLIRGTAHPDTLTAMLACLLAGRAYVPIEPQLPAARAAAAAAAAAGAAQAAPPIQAATARDASVDSLAQVVGGAASDSGRDDDGAHA